MVFYETAFDVELYIKQLGGIFKPAVLTEDE